jgi:hypothetical protein
MQPLMTGLINYRQIMNIFPCPIYMFFLSILFILNNLSISNPMFPFIS